MMTSGLPFCSIQTQRYGDVQACHAMFGSLRIRWNPLRPSAVRTFSTAPPIRAAGSTASAIPVPPPLPRLETQQDMQQAREWIARFEKVRTDAWPKSTFSPSSLCALLDLTTCDVQAWSRRRLRDRPAREANT
jgi:hypothetical protein